MDVTRRGHNKIAVLDLKGAYPSVHRAKLLQVVGKRLPATLLNMAGVLLLGDILQTVGDPYNCTEELSRGVPGGLPLCATIFNLYIDTLAHQLHSMPRAVSSWPSNIFADDVQLLTATALVLQRLLNVSSIWARAYGLTWAPSKN